MEDFLKKAKEFALDEQKRTSMPLLPHIELSNSKAIELATKLGANADIVSAGTYLMDCMIGEALKQNRLKDHIAMSADKAKQLLSTSNVSSEDSINIEKCVLEHHGVPKFYSLESEICCNADCYRFISIEGFSYAMRYLREMPFSDLIKLLENKVEEKWSALTLPICKKELEPQYKIIKNYLSYLQFLQ